MMRRRFRILLIISLLPVALFISAFRHSLIPQPAVKWDGNTTVQDILFDLTGTRPAHYIQTTPEMVNRRRMLFLTGRAIGPDGNESRLQSKHYKCTNCHNTVREDPVLNNSDPEARLTYSNEMGLPFLQGTTMWGVVNRETWYNGDYFTKYGEA